MNHKKISLLSLIMLLSFISCEQSETEPEASLKGTYVGTLTAVNSEITTSEPAVADVKLVDEGLLKIHCYSTDFDTLIMLNYYQHEDQYKLCATGEDFEHMYEHSLSNQHMEQGMMMNETEWMYHLGQEHSESDEHFGEFGMKDHSFEYMFLDGEHNLQFQGIKK